MFIDFSFPRQLQLHRVRVYSDDAPIQFACASALSSGPTGSYRYSNNVDAWLHLLDTALQCTNITGREDCTKLNSSN